MLAKTKFYCDKFAYYRYDSKLLLLSNGGPSERDDVAEIILQCVTEIILTFDFDALMGLSESDPNRALGSVVELFNLGFRSCCGITASQVIFDRLLLRADQKEYISNGSTTNRPTIQRAKVASIYALEIMTPKPDEAVSLQLRNIGCGSTFVQISEYCSITGRSLSERGHVEKILNEACAGHSKVVWETVHENFRLTLRITKPKVMRVHGAWLPRSQNGQNLLTSMGTEAIQRQIMGKNYDWIRGAIVGAAGIGPSTFRLLANITNGEFLETPTGPPAKKARYN
ncbi:hypothetical protein F5146DRAFT_1118288 [Armillaria mellea]|nr:hypothetical protein F5146DRAFT_1118288 [Armillaria mellea]